MFRGRNAFQAIQYPPLGIYQNHIRRSAQQLSDELKRSAVAQFTPAFQTEDHQPVSTGLGNAENARPCQMLPEKHAEHGRLSGVFKALFRQMHAGVRTRRPDQHSAVFAGNANSQQQKILLRLLNLINSPVPQNAVQFLGQCADGFSIQSHLRSVPP